MTPHLTHTEALAGARAVIQALAGADPMTFDHGRAAALLVSYLDDLAVALDAPTAQPVYDLPAELDVYQLAEIARAWPWPVRDGLARYVARAMSHAGIEDYSQRQAVQASLAWLFGELD